MRIVLLETRVSPDTRASCDQVAIVGPCARARSCKLANSFQQKFDAFARNVVFTVWPARTGREGGDRRSIQRSEILAFRDTIPEISDHVFGQRADKGRKEGRQARGSRETGETANPLPRGEGTLEEL